MHVHMPTFIHVIWHDLPNLHCRRCTSFSCSAGRSRHLSRKDTYDQVWQMICRLEGTHDPHEERKACVITWLLTCCRQYNAVELKMVFEAAWAITNLAAGPPESVASVLPAAPLLAVLLRSNSTHIAEQSAWAIGKATAMPSAKTQLSLSIKHSDATLNSGTS